MSDYDRADYERMGLSIPAKKKFAALIGDDGERAESGIWAEEIKTRPVVVLAVPRRGALVFSQHNGDWEDFRLSIFTEDEIYAVESSDAQVEERNPPQREQARATSRQSKASRSHHAE